MIKYHLRNILANLIKLFNLKCKKLNRKIKKYLSLMSHDMRLIYIRLLYWKELREDIRTTKKEIKEAKRS